MMLLSKTSEYALQALIYLAAQPADKPCLSREVAEYLGAPSQYLAKILQDMAKFGILNSYKGRGGGFVLRDDARNMPLLEILNLVESRHFGEGCVLGLKTCSDNSPCPMHFQWQPIKKNVMDMLASRTLANIAEEMEKGTYRLTALANDGKDLRQ